MSPREIVDTYRISTILIDPGHGGRDSGAVGRHGSLVVKEKDVTLAVSLRLAQLLRATYPQKNSPYTYLGYLSVITTAGGYGE